MATRSLERNVKHVMFTSPEADRQPLLESYEMGAEIGKGSYGKVLEVTHRTTGQVCAVKIIRKDKNDKRFNRFVENELKILKFVQHRRIMALFEIIETPDNFYLVTELCERGELQTRIYSEQEVRVIISRLIDVVQYLHANNLVHRDIKPENILLVASEEDPFDIRLGDFGLSCHKGTEDMLLDSCGTPLYMAPEVLKNHAYSDKCDIWSVGVIMYQLLTGVDSLLLNSMLLSDRLDYSMLPDVSIEAQNLLRRMLAQNPANRDSASEILHNPWITGNPSNGEIRMNVLELMEQMNTENCVTTATSDSDTSPIRTLPLPPPNQKNISKSHTITRPPPPNLPPPRKISYAQGVAMRSQKNTDKFDPRRRTLPDPLPRPVTSLSPRKEGGLPSYMQDTQSRRIAKSTVPPSDPRAAKRKSVHT